MKFISTNGPLPPISFREAIHQGLASDGGLLMPEIIPQLGDDQWTEIINLDPIEGYLQLLSPYLSDEIGISDLSNIIEETFTFPLPIHQINEQVSCLELFHGPTMSFKDVGARFLARCLGHFGGKNSKKHWF